MRYPNLVPKAVCKVPCHVTVYSEEISKDGEPIVVFDADLMCNYQDKAKTILTDQQKLVRITGTALFCGDIAPDIPVISSGTFTVMGVQRGIEQGMKARNPDGSVNYTMLEVV